MANINKNFMNEMAEEVTPVVVNVNTGTDGTEKKDDSATSDTTNIDDKTDKTDKTDTTTAKKDDVQPTEETQKVIDGLKLEIENLTKDVTGKADLEKSNTDLTTALDLLKQTILGKETAVTEYEAIIKSIIDAKLASVPENLKSLVPANLSMKDQLDWLTKAETSGIFKETKKENPDVEIGKPLNPNGGNKNVDTSKLSASAIMALAYGNTTQTGKKK